MRTIHRFFPILLYLSLLASVPLTAQTDTGTVVVTATKHEIDLRRVSTTATVVTAEQIKRRGYRNVVDVLRNELSFDIAQSGGPGGLSYPQIRGLTGKYIVVLIDGVRVNDPADANGGAGTIFSHLTTGDIARIEVIRGAMSPLYGSNAATGVINIITRKGSGDGQLELAYEGGSLASHRVDFGYSVAQAGWAIRADQNITDTEGVIEGEKYRNLTTSVKFGYASGSLFEWETLLRYTHMEQNFAEFNENFGGSPWTIQLPDPNQKNDFDYTTIGTRIGHSIFDNWRQELNFGFGRRNRQTVDPDDGLLGRMTAPYDGFTLDYMNFYDTGQSVPVYDLPFGPADYSFTGTNVDIDYRHTVTYESEKANSILTTGFEYLYRDYEQNGTQGELTRNVGNVAGYIHNQLLLAEDALSVNTGLRVDEHQESGGSTTGSAGFAYDWRRIGLVLRANIGSAYRAPSIYELYTASPYVVGNPGLNPEESTSWEFGFEKYSWEGKFKLTAATWHTEITDAIIFETDPSTYITTYVNADEARSDGVEVSITTALRPDWLVGLNYTYTDSRKYVKADDSWSRMIQVPYNKFNLNLTWLYRDCSLSVDCYWVDDTRLRWNNIDRLDSYFKLDLTARAPLGEHLEFSFRVRNMLDEDYWESYGMLEPGVAVFGGLSLKY
ncbi:MAG: TonB-dependent receptor [Candidatus Glassbacteria bacterium]|nr:TonB-dependent receptor [Candidatus Glassbacteria bacterium]